MKNLDESYFEQVHDVATGRLSPDGIASFFLASLIFSGVVTGISYLALSSENLMVDPFIRTTAEIFKVLFIVHVIITVIFLVNKISFEFQKLQAVLLSIFGLKFSVETYFAFLALYEDRWADESVLYTGLLFLVGGIVLLILMTIRTIKRVKKGEFKEGGGGLLGFKGSKKGYVSLPIIFVVVVFSGAIARAQDADSVATVYTALFFAVALQYSLALALPEFFLLTYCKLRFPSFHVEYIKRVKRRKRNRRNMKV